MYQFTLVQRATLDSLAVAPQGDGYRGSFSLPESMARASWASSLATLPHYPTPNDVCNKCNSFPLDRNFLLYYGRVMNAYLNASEVAKLLKVDRATVTRWAQQGQLQGAIRLKGQQQWRIPLATYAALVKQQSASKP